jgi:hypothetical protein
MVERLNRHRLSPGKAGWQRTRWHKQYEYKVSGDGYKWELQSATECGIGSGISFKHRITVIDSC